MLHYLVDERQLDINALDTGEPKHPTFSYCGTPICYAAHCQKGTPVVRWLLNKGADPTFKNPDSGFNAVACATKASCDEVLSVLEEWQGSKPSS